MRVAAVPVALLALTLLAPALGGSTELWAKAVIAIATGALLVIAPPRLSLGRMQNVLFALPLLLAALAFLPARWFSEDPMRADLISLGAQLPTTRTPQPMLTLQALLALFFGLAWAYYLLAQNWGNWRAIAWRVYAFGILALATALIGAFVTRNRIPFWPDVPEFGFFPNRNQTGDVLGLGGVMIYALGLQQCRSQRPQWWAWFATLPIVCSALIVNYSRAGIVLFFCGAFAVHLYWCFEERKRRQPIVAFAVFALLLALFLYNGGATLARFTHDTPGLISPEENGRLTIYEDSFALLKKAPLLGIGLGNFAAEFAVVRHFSVGQNQSIHPESDWLWLAIELGVLAALAIVALLIWWAGNCRPFNPGTVRLMRVAALVCVCGFVVHGFADVSGHRFGSLWPALLLASTAMHPEFALAPARNVALIFRAIGLCLVAIGAFWLLSYSPAFPFPTTATLDRLRSEVEHAIAQNDFATTEKLTTQALEIAPLDWSLRYQKATAEAALYHSDTAATRDFAIARYLMPYWPELTFQEGEIWLGVGNADRAFDAWSETLRRAPDRAADFYAQMFSLVKSDAPLLDRWRRLAHFNKACLLTFFHYASEADVRLELPRLLAEDPNLRTLNSRELAALFSDWYQRGDKLWLADFLQHHPQWQPIAWRELARTYGDFEDYRPAVETVLRFASKPKFDLTAASEPLETARAKFRSDPRNLPAGLAWYTAEKDAGHTDAARRVLDELIAVPHAPKYLFYLRAELDIAASQWREAWQDLQQCDELWTI